MNVPFVDLRAQYESIKTDIDAALADVLSDMALIRGRHVERFEKEFASYLGIEHCVGCANGTDAIEIVLKALGIGPGMEVIVPARTWISTAEAVTTCGAKVVFADTLPDYYTIDLAHCEQLINERTKAIIPVHFYGLPAEMDGILALAKRHKLFVIEDTAQAHGARYKGQMVGTLGDAATFSFFPGKNLGAYGDAGAIVTRDEALAKRCRMIADHGRLGKHDHGLEGRNSRLDGLHAAILSAKLPYLERWTEARRQNAARYSDLLSESGLKLPTAPDHSRHVYHLYVVQVANRERVQETLQERGIATGIHYPLALPFLKAYAYKEHSERDFPVASAEMSKILSLPMYAELSAEQLSYVCQELRAATSEAA